MIYLTEDNTTCGVAAQKSLSLQEKLSILSDAAKYDVACTSSGVDRKNDGTGLGNAYAAGICHSFSADGRCISLLKILFSNECVYDCKYCVNRLSNDVPRASFTPEEVCTLVIEFYRRNYIEGLFLSSGVLRSPNYTMELIFVTIYKLRHQYNFQGYIHIKVIPGTDLELVNKIGYLADRVSVNLELPTTESLKLLAPQKSRKMILEPMRLVQNKIVESKESNMLSVGKGYEVNTGYGNMHFSSHDMDITHNYGCDGSGRDNNIMAKAGNSYIMKSPEARALMEIPRRNFKSTFAPAGQSTQMIVGATPETDFQIMTVAESLYGKFDLKRVFYSAFIPIVQDKLLPSVNNGGPPLLREHRLYQADWLLRFYHFSTNELLNEENPNFNTFFDPKCNWALNNLDRFPIEINTASYRTLLRIPGVGVNSAQRIVAARKMSTLDFNDLKKIGVVLKRALYFITCNGKMMYPTKIDEDYITRNLLRTNEKLPDSVTGMSYKQMSLFDLQEAQELSELVGSVAT